MTIPVSPLSTTGLNILLAVGYEQKPAKLLGEDSEGMAVRT